MQDFIIVKTLQYLKQLVHIGSFKFSHVPFQLEVKTQQDVGEHWLGNHGHETLERGLQGELEQIRAAIHRVHQRGQETLSRRYCRYARYSERHSIFIR